MRKRQMEGAARVDMRDYAVFSTEKRWGTFCLASSPAACAAHPEFPRSMPGG